MEKKYNAIRVHEKIERVYVDFSNYEKLHETTGFEYLSPLRSLEMNQLADHFDLPIAGLYDRKGKGGKSLGAIVSGFDLLPSPIILCLISEDKFFPLPEDRVTEIYKYIYDKVGLSSIKPMSDPLDDVKDKKINNDYKIDDPLDDVR